jgi:RNA polymerase sigma factor (sigma-70 family)
MVEMNLTDSLRLLRDYADHGNEVAFRELVERYVDLVYSAALRRVGGDADLARDVTQMVFTDLARKARSLRRVEFLGGWLHRHTGFVAAGMVRRERRRQIREQEAVHMNALNDSPETLWQQLAPMLDETIDSLDPADRQAVLLRFFERRDFRSIGAALGISDDAAQKRVSRALEKLRELLASRGITLTLVLLSTLMAGRVVKAAPAGLAADVAGLALAGASTGGLDWVFTKLANSLSFKIAAGGAVIVLSVWLFLPNRSTPGRESPQKESTVTVSPVTGRVPATNRQTPVTAAAGQTGGTNVAGKPLLLKIVAADVGKPVPDVELDYWLWEHGKVEHKKALHADRFGVCKVPVPEGTTELCLVSQRDGFADTLLDWRPDRGETIPGEYTLRLARAVSIGGRVVDPDGNPAAGAQVSFGNEADPATQTRPQSDDFGWPFWIPATTDAQGRWQIDRIGKQALRSVIGGARHPDYVGSASIAASRDPKVTEQLLAGTFVFTLGSAVTVRGVVVDSQGQPVPDAEVLVGHRGESGSREATNRADGTFVIVGCAPGQNVVTAQAKGYAPTTLQIDLTNNCPAIQITLRRGKFLKLKVVDANGKPVPNARVWLDTFYWGRSTNPSVQIEFNRQTDANGRLEWDEAPEQNLAFQVTAAGYMRSGEVGIRPDGAEHVITLEPALKISGTVRDATTGQPIPRFRIVTGWPRWDPIDNTTNFQWSTIDRFWMSFDGGKFQHTYEEPALGGTPNPGFVFKFEAEGYAPFVTRQVSATEREVRFDVSLNPASTTEVTVVLPDGGSADGVDIGLVASGTQLALVPGGFSHDNVRSGGSLLLTDNQGRFRLPPDPTVRRVIAAGPQGFGEATPAELATDPVIRMQPWGRLEGTYLQDGQPVAGAELQFEYGDRNRDAIYCDFNAFQTKTDSDGRFVFAKVPPGIHEVELLVPGTDVAGRKFWTARPLQKVTIHSGDTTTITIGDSEQSGSGLTQGMQIAGSSSGTSCYLRWGERPREPARQ